MSTQPGSDPIGDFQRWLMQRGLAGAKAGARGLGRDVTDRVRSTVGGGQQHSADVWDTATTEPPGAAEEPPECQWCPICRAARQYRDTGSTSGLGPAAAAASDTLAGLARGAFGLFESAMKAQQQQQQQRPGGSAGFPGPAAPPESPGSSDDGAVAGPGVAWPTVVHPDDEGGEAADEGGDAQEGGEPGHMPPHDGADQ